MRRRLIFGLLLAIVRSLSAQEAFEVASIKAADSDAPASILRSGNRLTFSNYSIGALILWAYDVRGDRLLGRLKGIDSARYDIVAVAPAGPAVPGRLNLMMRSLLASRFGLVVHTEKRELPYYALVVDKNGPKVQVGAAVGPGGQNPFSMTAPGHLTGTQVSPAMLAKVLTDQTGRFVQDRTGLVGVFDFTLEWDPDTLMFTAVKQQLGLRLDAVKGPVDVVVIDRVNAAPSEN